jgi:hypothetical protein
VGKHPIPIKSTAFPLIQELSLGEIEGVHPAVLNMLKQFPDEPILGLQEVSDALINDVFKIPRLSVVPVPGGSRFWCWAGVRAYLSLADRHWHEKIPVLNYGPRTPVQKIVYLAHKDWVFAPAITVPSQKTNWAFAQVWEANSDYVCRPVKPGSRRCPSGLKVYANLRGLGLRPLQADNVPEAPKSADRPESATEGNEEEGTVN